MKYMEKSPCFWPLLKAAEVERSVCFPRGDLCDYFLSLNIEHVHMLRYMLTRLRSGPVSYLGKTFEWNNVIEQGSFFLVLTSIKIRTSGKIHTEGDGETGFCTEKSSHDL
jgi:hypothetical protein